MEPQHTSRQLLSAFYEPIPVMIKAKQAEQVDWVSLAGHMLTGIGRGMAYKALPWHQQRICSLTSLQLRLSVKCRALQ